MNSNNELILQSLEKHSGTREVKGSFSPDKGTARQVDNEKDKKPFRSSDKEALKKKIPRALVETRKAQHEGDEETARKIVREIMAEAAPAALEASKEGSFNWVVEALKPLDELLLPENNDRCEG